MFPLSSLLAAPTRRQFFIAAHFSRAENLRPYIADHSSVLQLVAFRNLQSPESLRLVVAFVPRRMVLVYKD